MNAKLEAKLKTLPRSAGVYLHKSENGEIIYVGKAAVLKNRVKQYFLASKDYDAKTKALVADIYDTDWIETESEIDALFLESELVKRYMPRYNVLLRDDKSATYIRIDMKNEWPHVSFTRNPLDDKAEYFGPYYNSFAIKKALRYLRRVFPYYTKPPRDGERPDLDVHIGLSPRSDVTAKEYRQSLKQLIRYIKGEREAIVRDLEKSMQKAAKNHDFEKAAEIRNQILHIKELKRRIMFGDKESLSISKDQALSDIVKLLGLEKEPRRIEGYDISHMSGTNVVASMVVFINGVSDRAEYRKFKTSRERNDDFANMNEILTRRFSEKNIKAWGKPDLLLIDGGKGQLDAALKALEANGIDIPCIGLAKREEEIAIHYQKSRVKLDKSMVDLLGGIVTSSDVFQLVNIPNTSHVIKLLQRIRDESHRFAVSYHTTLKRAGQTKSVLQDVPGVGKISQKKLLKHFGSARAVQSATLKELTEVLGEARASVVHQYFKDQS